MAEFLAWDGMRWINAALASLTVILLVAGSILRWDVMPLRIKRILPWVVMTYVIIAYGSAEAAVSVEVIPLGYRVMFMSLSLCGLVVALLYGFVHDRYE